MFTLFSRLGVFFCFFLTYLFQQRKREQNKREPQQRAGGTVKPLTTSQN